MDIGEAESLIEELESKPVRQIESAKLAEAIEVMAIHFREELTGLSMKGVRGAPDWLGYETALWQLSERIRVFLQKRRDLRGRNELLDSCEKLSRNPSLGKGRQNLVLILGQFGGLEYKEAFRDLLLDEEVYGHAIKAASRAKIPGLESTVTAILDEEKTGWIRTAGRNYLKNSATWSS